MPLAKPREGGCLARPFIFNGLLSTAPTSRTDYATLLTKGEDKTEPSYVIVHRR